MHKPRRIITPIYNAQEWQDQLQGYRGNDRKDLSPSIPHQALIDGMGERRYYHGYDTVQNNQNRQEPETGLPRFPRPLLFRPRDDLMRIDDLYLAQAVTETDASSYPQSVAEFRASTSQERLLYHTQGWLGLYGDHEDEVWLREDVYDNTVHYPGKLKLALILLSGLLPYLMVCEHPREGD
jgi:hypothetical protein